MKERKREVSKLNAILNQTVNYVYINLCLYNLARLFQRKNQRAKERETVRKDQGKGVSFS